MELWLLLGILSYLFYAISTSIDKYMMNHKYGVLRTNTFKMLFDGVILLILGLVFFNLAFTPGLVLWSLVLGFLYATGGIIYFNALKLKDVEEAIPFLQSSEILLVFIASIIVFSELVNSLNYLGVALILVGVYAVLSRKGLGLPRADRGIFLILLLVITNAVYFLLVKGVLFDAQPISLAIMMYFSTTVFMFIYDLIFKRKSFLSLMGFRSDIFKIAGAALFGSMGTFLLYSAVALGNASKVYPIAGLESVLIFIIACVFLKEKFYWHGMIGTIMVFLGIFLVSV